MRRTDSLILGGGPAGAAAAIALARAGQAPLLIERNRAAADALCGGFLSWRTLGRLAHLGLSPETLGGHPIERLRLFGEGPVADVALPQRALGVSRLRLDSALLALAEAEGARVERGVAARRAAPGQVELSDGATLCCESLFLATGKHDCRGLARPRDGDDPMLGLRLRLPASAGLSRLVAGAIELHLFRGGYAGLLLQEDQTANLCMAVRKSRLSAADGDPRGLLAALSTECAPLGERLAFGDIRAPIEAIGVVPYGWRAREGVAGLFRLGDQAAVIPSLAGEGVGIALASGVMAAEYQLRAGSAGAVAFQCTFNRRVRVALGSARLIAAIAGTRTGRRIAPRLFAAFPTLGAVLAQLTRIAR